MFDDYDLNGDGFIDRDELAKLIEIQAPELTAANRK